MHSEAPCPADLSFLPKQQQYAAAQLVACRWEGSTSMTRQVILGQALRCLRAAELQQMCVADFAGFAHFHMLDMLGSLQVDKAGRDVPHCCPGMYCHLAQQSACRWQSYQASHVSQTLGLLDVAWLPCTCAPRCWATCRRQNRGTTARVLTWHMWPPS